MDSGIFRLQQEAARRVRLMEERNRRIANSYAAESREEETGPSAHISPEPLCAPRSAATYPVSASSREDDNDRLLLLLLALLLAKNGAPMELIVALLYLAM